LRKKSCTDFKHSIISSSSSLQKCPLPPCAYFETEPFSAYASFLTPSQTRSSFNFFFKVILSFNKTIFENTTNSFSGSLLSISVIILEPVFKASFPTDFAPEYNRCLKNGRGLGRSYSVTFLQPESSPVHRIYFSASALIYVVPSNFN